MSILVDTIIGEAATRLDDPNKARILPAGWLLYYNDAIEAITTDWKVLEQDATHDLLQDEDRYDYPDDLVQMKRWKWSPDPTDPTTYVKAGEIFDDEYDRLTTRNLPVGDAEYQYWARANFFQITPRPTATVVDAGLISYWKLATRATDAAIDLFPLPDTLRVLTREHMLMSAKRTLTRYDEYQVDLSSWELRVSKIADKIEDRSDDRRARLRIRRRGPRMN